MRSTSRGSTPSTSGSSGGPAAVAIRRSAASASSSRAGLQSASAQCGGGSGQVNRKRDANSWSSAKRSGEMMRLQASSRLMAKQSMRRWPLPWPNDTACADQAGSQGARTASQCSHVGGSSRHSTTPRGLAVTASAATLSDASLTSAPFASSSCSASSAAKSSRIGAIAGDLPLEGGPTSACHSTSGSSQRDPSRTTTPAPQRPATAPRTATARHSRRARRWRWRCRNPVAPEGRQEIEGKGRNGDTRVFQQGLVDLTPAGRRCRRQRLGVMRIDRRATAGRPASGRPAGRDGHRGVMACAGPE